MAWTPAQLAKARKLFKARGNKKTWSECVALATKGSAKKRPVKKAAVSGTKNKTAKPAKKIVIVRKAKTVKIAGIGGTAMGYVRDASADLDRLEKQKAAATTKADKNKFSRAIAATKKTKTIWKNLL